MSKSFIAKIAAVGLAAGLTVGSSASFARSADSQIDANQPAFEQVDSIPMLTRPHSWQVLDEDSVIVWATPFDPYLVELAFKSHDLKFAEVIGITQFGSRVYARFDAVKVGGFRYPIDSIYKMTREEARNLVRGT
ncbi:MAG TPA: DUF6491 family protein [Gammaproteobacteria bacterium]|nr:DUF6491 family protein [Gammaproteobacteria bacterium]